MKNGNGTLVWFRSDLRCADNTALDAARDDDGPLHAVFVATPDTWRDHDWGRAKVGFLRRNLVALGASLARRGIPLHITSCETFDGTTERLAEVLAATGCGRLVFNREHEVNERARDETVTNRLTADGFRVDSFLDQTVLDVSRLLTGQGGFYSVFTPFRKRWLAWCDDEGWERPVPAPAGMSSAAGADEVPAWDQTFAGVDRDDLWPAGEKVATERLEAFINERAGRYSQRRDLPAVNGTSVLSPYLALGVLSPRQCLAAAVDANEGRLSGGSKGLETWITELIWREFYRHVLIGYPRVCRHQPFQLKTRDLAWRTDDDDFAAWCEGRTGVPLVDAGMRQLNQTGWMHNRVRMVVAMFLTKNLLIDWRWGERYFMQHLVDGDLASNNGGWQWSASTGTDAAPYFRIFNPFTQGSRFDPDAEYIRRFVPELGDAPLKFIHDPLKHPDLRPADYPAPIFDYKASRQRAIDAFKALG